MSDRRPAAAAEIGTSSLIAPAVAVLALTGALPVALAALTGAGRSVVLGLGSVGLALAVAQTATVLALAGRVRTRVDELRPRRDQQVPAAVRAFPLRVAIACGLLAAVGGASLAVGASLVVGLGAFDLLGEHGPWIGLFQAMFLPALHRIARGWTARLLAQASVFGDARGKRRRSPATAVFVVLVTPAVAVSLALGLIAERIHRDQAIGGSAEIYGRLTEAVLAARPLPGGGDTGGLVEALTRFDEASPFAYSPAIGRRGALDPDGLALLERSLADERSGAAVEEGNGVGLVWSTLEDGQTVVGVRLTVGRDPRAPFILVSLVLAAAFGAALLSLWLGGRLRDVLAGRGAAIDALPDGEPPRLRRSYNREIARLDEEIERARTIVAGRRAGQRAMAERQREAREKKAKVFTGMSHDLRSPLSSVIGFTDLLLKGMDGELTADQRASVARIAQEAERLLVLIGDILDTAKLEAGRFELERAWVPSVEILTECEVGALRLVASKDIEFTCELQPGLPPVLVDKDRVLQALLSLVCRAVDSMERGTVRLKAWRHTPDHGQGAELRVDIIDSAGALPAESRERLAGALGATGDAEASGETSAIELGISLARRILKLHGGGITVTSHGRGSVFTVTVPLDESPDSA